jgi:hypothetical protein
MTLTFHLYQDGIEVAEPTIYARDLNAYKRDSKRSLRSRWHRKLERTRALRFLVIVFAVASLPFRRAIRARTPEISLLLATTLIATHSIYV